MRDLQARRRTELTGNRSLSGQQILEALIAISDEADRQFKPEMLQDFWRPFDGGNYSRFVRDIAANFGLNEMPLYEPVEPISGYNRHHHIPKRDLKRLIPYLKISDQAALERIKEEEELLLVSYHVWYITRSSRNYFHSEDVSRINKWYLRMRGMREITEVEEEVVNILKPHQINQRTMPLEIVASLPRDLFEYKGRVFSLGRKQGRTDNEGKWVDVLWAFGLYTKLPEPIGYILFNEEVEKRERLFLP
ncbi:hypothetical protein HZC31_07990 [Candidatus Woesearchaeota archaeon]|nr:hypothetical protein [Candidatus Woesearchaeota archaeon]